MSTHEWIEKYALKIDAVREGKDRYTFQVFSMRTGGYWGKRSDNLNVAINSWIANNSKIVEKIEKETRQND